MKLKKLVTFVIAMMFVLSMSINAYALTFVSTQCTPDSYTKVASVTNIGSSGGNAKFVISALNSQGYVSTASVKLDMTDKRGKVTTMYFDAKNGQNLYFGNDHTKYVVSVKLPKGSSRVNTVSLQSTKNCSLNY